jgi:hypothetical protein
MARIELPALPSHDEFEDYTAALLRLGKYYVERNLAFRDIEEILELDIVLTNYDSEQPDLQVVEVKSGDWGFPDLFKVYGWMKFLEISKGLFVAKRDKENKEFIQKVAREMNIDLFVIPDISDIQGILAKVLPAIPMGDLVKMDLSIWRFAYWLERCMIKHLWFKKKTNLQLNCYSALCNYYQQVNSGIFFIENIVERVDKLYSTFMNEYPHITAKTAHELVGDDFEDEYDDIPRKTYRDTFFKCEYTDIQISMFIEHRARLAILKSAVDYMLYKNAGVSARTQDITKKGILGFEYSLMKTLPETFRKGLEELSSHEYFSKYPLFWQWFLWVFGGFILRDYKEQEYIILSEKTGIPEDEIDNAFNCYQILFPLDDGWFLEYPESMVRHIKMFPVPFMGVGANYRLWLYCEDEKRDYTNLKTSGRHTVNDLVKWNNLLVEVLSYNPY